jgi:hypothetical protein
VKRKQILDEKCLIPARDYNRRFHRHNPYLPKLKKDEATAKGEPKKWA